MTRRYVALLAAVGVVAVAALFVAREPSPTNGSGRAGAPAAATGAMREFVPPVRHAGDDTVLPTAFPDGTRVELRYPRALRLHRLGLRPHTSARLEGCCARDLRILYMGTDPRPPAEFAAGERPVERIPRKERRAAELWEAPAGDPGGTNLVVPFGPWRVVVGRANGGETLTDAELNTWVRNLGGRVTRTGLLVLQAKRPLVLARFGAHAGPQLWLDEGGTSVILLSGRWSSGTRSNPQTSEGFTSWYVPAASVTVQLYGADRGYRNRVRMSLRIRQP